MDKININLVIADRTYPLKIDPSEEEHVRKAAKQINNKIREYQSLYEAKDKQDFLAMVALQYATDSLRTQDKPTIEDSNFPDKLESLDKQLQEFLNAT